jgi:hypothetical protein
MYVKKSAQLTGLVPGNCIASVAQCERILQERAITLKQISISAL